MASLVPFKTLVKDLEGCVVAAHTEKLFSTNGIKGSEFTESSHTTWLAFLLDYHRTLHCKFISWV